MENSDNRIYKQFYSMDFKINDLVTVILLHTLSMFQRRKLLMKTFFDYIFYGFVSNIFRGQRWGLLYFFNQKQLYMLFTEEMGLYKFGVLSLR